MNLSASLVAIALLAVGCAGRAPAPITPAPPPAALAVPTPSAQAAPEAVELRHFYLLAPGPGATLVITRSDSTTTVH